MGYAMRTVSFLAACEDAEQYVPVRGIAEKLYLSSHYFTKILQALPIYEMVMTYRSPNGGAASVRPARDVLVAIDGEVFCEDGLFNFPECVENEHCVLHTPGVMLPAGFAKYSNIFILRHLAK